MMLPPVMLDQDSDPTWSVQVELPPGIDAEIRGYVEEDELTAWTVLIHEALYLLPDCVLDPRDTRCGTTGGDPGRLPKELYEFIRERIASGGYKTPTDVVCAAMPYLLRARRKATVAHYTTRCAISVPES
jgi:hypothetical protein